MSISLLKFDDSPKSLVDARARLQAEAMKDPLSHSTEKESIPDAQPFVEEDFLVGLEAFYS